jgi:AraC-like DNA-binding protein
VKGRAVVDPAAADLERTSSDSAVQRAVRYVHEHFADDIDLDDLAQVSGLSRTVLRERFLSLLGDPPMRYCAKWRMLMAANMLREGKANTSNIAYSVGFDSEAAFSRAFKRKFGQPPIAWKRTTDERNAFDPHPARLAISGAPTSVNWVARSLGSFLRAHPELSVEIEPNPRKIDFDVDPYDCAIRCGLSPPTGLHVEELFKVDFTPMCSPEFLAANPLNSFEDIANVPRITPNDPWWGQFWNELGITPPPFAQGMEMGAQMLDGIAAMQGQGVALLTPMFWRDELKAGSLVTPFDRQFDGQGIFWLVYPTPRHDWPKIRQFSGWLHKLCAR